MPFRTRANIDPNHHKGLIALDSITGNALVLTGQSLTNSQPAHVAIVDGNGSQITSFGGGTQYAELATTSPGTGTLSLGRYKSSAPSLTDGQIYGLQLDSSGNLKVTGSLSVGGTTDNSAFAAGSGTGTPSMGFYHSTIDAVTDGRAAAVGITSKRAMMVNLQTAAGVEITNTSNALDINLKTSSITLGVSLAAETTKVIGVTRTADGAGNLLTSNSTTPSAKFALDQNITSILGTAPTTVGKLDIKGADGDVFVRQATASNLNATVVGTGTFVTQATLAAETTKIIGAINNLPATVDTNSGNKSASTLRVVLATDQPALTNKLLVTPDSVALPANQSVNQAQVAGTATSVNNGTVDAGTQRVTIASDSTGLVKLATGANTIGALTANQSVNQAQVAGNTTAVDVGASSSGTQRVVQANNAGKTILSAGGSAASNGNNTLVAAGTNKLKVKAFMLSTTSTTAMTCIFQSGAGGTELWRVILQAPTSTSVGATQGVQAPDWLFATASATLLNLNLSSANAVHWSVSYYDEA